MSNKNISYRKILAISRPKIQDIKYHSLVKTKGEESSVPSSSFWLFLSRNKVIPIIFLLVLGLSLGNLNVFAPIFSPAQEVEAQYDEEKAKLQKELDGVNKQIAQYESVLATTKQQKISLQNKIRELESRAKKISLQIKSTNINLQYLNVQIQETTRSILKTSEKAENTKKKLAKLLQDLYQIKRKSPLEILIEKNKLSDFFDYLNALNNIQTKIEGNIEDLSVLKATLNNQNKSLGEDRKDAKNLLSIQLLQKNDLTQSTQEKEHILKITKGKESVYQQMLILSRKRADEIRNKLYELAGVKSHVNFGEALAIANWVSSRTGIRPAFLLAILTQESNLGKNVGTCNRASDPSWKSWRNIMKPTRDRTPFLQICKELGINPNNTPVSCPINSPSRGLIAGKNSWGGAMGPAQFIPSTWMVYKNRVAQVTGHALANPWDIRDAFVAAALYLTDHGAAKRTRSAEWRAAMIYFSGSTNPRYSFYGNSVMAIADKYEKNINYLNKVKNQ